MIKTTPRVLTAMLAQMEAGKVSLDTPIALFDNDYSTGALAGDNVVASVSKLTRSKDKALEQQERDTQAEELIRQRERDTFTENQ